MMTMAVLIAGFGLVRDSDPMVIGAMLISPLTTPLMALCTSLVLGQPGRQLRAFAVLLAASLGGFGVGALMMFILSESTSAALDSEELLARGCAAPLPDQPVGNRVAGSATMLLMGVSPPYAAREHSRRIKMGLVGATFAVLVVTVPLAEHTRREFHQSADQQDAEALARAWGSPAGLEIETELRGTDDFLIDARGPAPPPPIEPLADRLAAELEEEVKVTVRYTKRVEREVESSP